MSNNNSRPATDRLFDLLRSWAQEEGEELEVKWTRVFLKAFFDEGTTAFLFFVLGRFDDGSIIDLEKHQFKMTEIVDELWADRNSDAESNWFGISVSVSHDDANIEYIDDPDYTDRYDEEREAIYIRESNA